MLTEVFPPSEEFTSRSNRRGRISALYLLISGYKTTGKRKKCIHELNYTVDTSTLRLYADEKSAVVLVSTLNDNVIELTQWFSVNLFTSQ